MSELPKEVAYWEERFRKAQQARTAIEEQWYLNLAFYFGKQWAVFHRTAVNGLNGVLIDPPATNNRVRLVSNRIRPIIRREITKLTKEEGQFFVTPNTTEPSDVAAARAGDGLAEYSMDQGDFNGNKRRATFWLSICGSSFMKTYCPAVNANVVYDPISPLQIYAPLLQEETVDAQPYIFHARGETPEQVYNKYDVDLKPDASATGTALEQRFLNSIGIRNTDPNLVFVKEIWVNPCRNYPDGAMLVIAGSKVIYWYKPSAVVEQERQMQMMLQEAGVQAPIPGGEWRSTGFPFRHSQYPFTKFDHIPTGRFYGESVITDLIPLQKEYNRTRSQMVESKNRTSKPAMTYTKGAIDATKVNSTPGQMIPVNPGYEAPKYLDSPSVNNTFTTEVELIRQDFDDGSNQFEISKGRTPPGIEAASAIAYLQEENDSILHLTIASLERGTERIGKQTLSLIQQFWDDNKKVKVVSQDNSMEVLMFSAADMADNTDLHVESGSMAPRSMAAKQAFITELIKTGIIPAEKGLRYLQMSETSRFYDELQADSRMAQRENMKMKQGIPVQVTIFENKISHLYEHALFMKSQEFEAMAPEQQTIFLQHYEMTQQGVLQEQMASQQQEQPQEGQMSNAGTS